MELEKIIDRYSEKLVADKKDIDLIGNYAFGHYIWNVNSQYMGIVKHFMKTGEISRIRLVNVALAAARHYLNGIKNRLPDQLEFQWIAERIGDPEDPRVKEVLDNHRDRAENAVRCYKIAVQHMLELDKMRAREIEIEALGAAQYMQGNMPREWQELQAMDPEFWKMVKNSIT